MLNKNSPMEFSKQPSKDIFSILGQCLHVYDIVCSSVTFQTQPLHHYGHYLHHYGHYLHHPLIPLQTHRHGYYSFHSIGIIASLLPPPPNPVNRRPTLSHLPLPPHRDVITYSILTHYSLSLPTSPTNHQLLPELSR